MSFDASWFRRVLGQYPTGVCVVTAVGEDERPAGLVIGSFTSVSLDPPLVGFLPDKSSTSWPRIAPAGHFCINVLAGDQEDVCRRFASKAPDKFEGIPWRAGVTGSPILEDVVAWIDCDLDSVTEAGDHWLVLGRVRELDVERGAPPLLFYQGGYGSFQPLSYVSQDEDLAGQMYFADIARPDMEALAADTDATVHAFALVRDELVIVASAGDATPAFPIIGARLPARPPVASPFLAFSSPERVDAWLRGAPPELHDEYRARLAEARARGYSVGVFGPAYVELRRFMSRARAGEQRRPAEEIHDVIPNLPLDPLGYEHDDVTRVLELYAPVFGQDERVVLVLSIAGLPRDATAADKERLAQRLLEAARSVTEKVGGAVPAG